MRLHRGSPSETSVEHRHADQLLDLARRELQAVKGKTSLQWLRSGVSSPAAGMIARPPKTQGGSLRSCPCPSPNPPPPGSTVTVASLPPMRRGGDPSKLRVVTTARVGPWIMPALVPCIRAGTRG